MLCLIPARGGSKRLPRKNLYPLAGMPLIVHTLRCALAVDSFERIIVSTDDEEIASVCEDVAGIEVPFRRPAALAADGTLMSEVCLHAADWLREVEGHEPPSMCLLQPTSPLRRPEDVEGALEMFHDLDAEFVVSVAAAKPVAWHQMIARDGRLTPVVDVAPRVAAGPRQDLPPTVVLNGAAYVFDVEALRVRRSWFGPRTYGYPMPTDRSTDIDSEEDLRLVEAVIVNGGGWQGGTVMPEPSIMVH